MYCQKNLTSISNWAFEYCESLKTITLPDTITSLGFGVFDNCKSLEKIIYKGSKQPNCKFIIEEEQQKIAVEVPGNYQSSPEKFCGITMKTGGIKTSIVTIIIVLILVLI